MGSDKPRELPKISGDEDEEHADRTTKVESRDDRRMRLMRGRERLGKVHTYFIVLTGPMSGKMVRVPKEPIIIGRATDAHFRIGDDGVSRHHARVTHDETGNVALEDLSSANGTFVNGELVPSTFPQKLRDGDKIQIGPTTILKFTLTDGVDEDFLRGMYDAANRDALTAVHNRRAFLERLPAEFAFSKRHGAPLSILMLDVDHFKDVNDTHGHLGGDAVLTSLGKMLTGTLRAEDFVARYGGEEFVVLARATPQDRAVALAERLRALACGLAVEFAGKKISVTVSIGAATFPEVAVDNPNDLVAKADEALYAAKAAGRNRVVGA